MFKLSAEQKAINIFMGDSNNTFVIPDYQRPYSWEDEECSKLWQDILTFAFPNNDCSQFGNDFYFLGTLVVFRNANGQLEIIDGQQRLITITLLLRAFYEAYGEIMTDDTSHLAKWEIAKCLWVVPLLGGSINMSKLKIHSEAASDNDIKEFLAIMLEGKADKDLNGRYAQNYRLFQKKIKDFLENYPGYFQLMPQRILQNCLVLPIETDGQDTALRIFSTMNDRGMPLSDSDIFKAKLYKAYSDHGQKDFLFSSGRILKTHARKLLCQEKATLLMIFLCATCTM